MTSAAPSAGTAAQRSPSGETPGGAKESTVPFDLHKPEVESSVTAFQTHLRGFFGRAMGRGAKYVPTMADMLAREGLPAELAYLPLIESGYRPHAVSPAGAAGPWQFIPETGRRYGLRIDSMVDERRDPIKSTQAAAQYLKELHQMFGDWELSLAAYNSGEHRVARIIAGTEADDFWDMRERGYLPSETSEYVPRFLAAVRIATAPESYGFDLPEHVPFHFETVHVDRQVSLRTAAGLCGVSAAELAELNPALRRGITPSGYALHVPAGAAAPLRAALASYVQPARAARSVTRNGRASQHKALTAKAGSRSRQVTSRSARQASGRSARRTASRPHNKSARIGKESSGPTRSAQSSHRGSGGKKRLARAPAVGTGSKSVAPRRKGAPKRAQTAKLAASSRGGAAKAVHSGRRRR